MGIRQWEPPTYPKRTGEYVYEVRVAKDETVRLSHRYRAHLSNAERIENRRLMYVQVNVPDTYGPTVSEAMRALDALSRRGLDNLAKR